jgi:hypothetical protein
LEEYFLTATFMVQIAEKLRRYSGRLENLIADEWLLGPAAAVVSIVRPKEIACFPGQYLPVRDRVLSQLNYPL